MRSSKQQILEYHFLSPTENWWSYTHISSPRIDSLHWSLILVWQILWVWTNAYITCICHYCIMQSSFAALKILIYIPFNAYFIIHGINSYIYSDKTKDCACDDWNALKLFPNIHFMSISFFMPFLIFLGLTGWPLIHGYSHKKWNSTVGLFCLLYLSSTDCFFIYSWFNIHLSI